MSSEATIWVLNRLSQSEAYKAVTQVDDNLLQVELKDRPSFIVGVLGEKACVEKSAVEPIFSKPVKPSFITNIPSKAIWRGDAILPPFNFLGTLDVPNLPKRRDWQIQGKTSSYESQPGFEQRG